MKTVCSRPAGAAAFRWHRHDRGLAQDIAIHHHDGVGSDHEGVRVGAGQGVRFAARQPLTVRHRLFSLPYGLVDIRRTDLVRNADEREQFRRRGDWEARMTRTGAPACELGGSDR